MKKALIYIFSITVLIIGFQNCGKHGFEAEYYGKAISSSTAIDSEVNSDTIGDSELPSDTADPVVDTTVPGMSKIVFKDDFDSQPDWTTTMHTTSSGQRVDQGDILPVDWFALYQGTKWSPETGFPDKHASLEILTKNIGMARGGKGKSAVNWRESHSLGWKNWASDSQLVKYFGSEYKEMYIEFYIRFSPDFYGRKNAGSWASKYFRVGSYRGTGNIVSGYQGDLGPIFIAGYKRDNYGVRNLNTFRGGPYGENYYFKNEHDGGSFNFSDHTKGHGFGGQDPKVPDLVNGGFLIDNKEILDHDQVYGPHQTWTKMGFYVKMNSSPGANDGIFRQYLNDEQIVSREAIPWVETNKENKMVGWNYLAIGGNDYFQPYENEMQFEDWYAIDDLLVLDGLPDNIKNK